MKKLLLAFLLACFALPPAYAYNQEKLFYLTPDVADTYFSKEQIQQITDHAKSIDILGPQVFQLDEHGVIWGTLDARLLAVAREHNLKVMPLITNPHFLQEPLHKLLHDPAAQEKAISGMLVLCEQFHLYGLQFDFENISVNDKNDFTRFFQLAAARLHQKGYAISIAVVPHTSEIYSSDYDRWLYENWSGAYDYRALGQSSDFISLMTYDQHTSLTTPGPLAALPMVEKALELMLKDVPARKISLGIPSYSGYWFTGKMGPDSLSEKYSFRSKEVQISYSRALSLLGEFNQALSWQDQWKSSYAMYLNNEKLEYLFVEDAKSFEERMNLAVHRQVRGISVWKLGMEDPAIWNNKNLH